MMRTLLLILSLLALIACEPGRCLRHSDCPTGASCKRGVCRLPPNQSTSLAQPGDQENQSAEPLESGEKNEEQSVSQMDASSESTLPQGHSSTSASSQTSQGSSASESADGSTSGLAENASSPYDANVESAWDAALTRDAAFDASSGHQDAATSNAETP